MNPLIAMGALAAIGALKSEMLDKPARARAQKVEAMKQRSNPWTELKGERLPEVDTLQSMLTFGTAGGSLAGGLNQIEHQDAMNALAHQREQAAVAAGAPSTVAAVAEPLRVEPVANKSLWANEAPGIAGPIDWRGNLWRRQ